MGSAAHGAVCLQAPFFFFARDIPIASGLAGLVGFTGCFLGQFSLIWGLFLTRQLPRQERNIRVLGQLRRDTCKDLAHTLADHSVVFPAAWQAAYLIAWCCDERARDPCGGRLGNSLAGA